MDPDNHTTDDPDEQVDELALLRAVNPVAAEDVADLASSPRAQAIRTELMMDTRTSLPDRGSTRRTMLAAALLLVLAFGGVVVALTMLGEAGPTGSQDLADGSSPASTQDERGATGVPSAVPGAGSASCVATYTLATLGEREHAFAGTVTAIDGDEITFEVEEVFRGDVAGALTLGGGLLLAGTSPDSGPPLTVGDRVLVAGDGRFAWGCGFTQPYDDDVAARWRDALEGP